MNEQELIDAAAQGNMQCWNVLYNRMRPPLLALSLRILGDADEAKDALQETFIRIHASIHRLRDHRAFAAWSRRILVNCCYQIARGRRFTRLSLDAMEELPAAEPAWDRVMEEREDLNRMRWIVSQLPENLRATILIRYFSVHNSYEDIATILGVPIGTVRSRLALARAKLSTLWQATEESDDRETRRSMEWNAFYGDSWSAAYRNEVRRKKFLEHFAVDVRVRYTSGKPAAGRHLLENEIEEDLRYGTEARIDAIHTSGDVTIIEGTNIHSPDFPDRCPPRSLFVLFRHGGTVGRLHYHHSTRKGAECPPNGPAATYG